MKGLEQLRYITEPTDYVSKVLTCDNSTKIGIPERTEWFESNPLQWTAFYTRVYSEFLRIRRIIVAQWAFETTICPNITDRINSGKCISNTIGCNIT